MASKSKQPEANEIRKMSLVNSDVLIIVLVILPNGDLRSNK